MQSDPISISEAMSKIGIQIANVLAQSITNQSEQWYFVTNMYDQLLTDIPDGNWLKFFPFRLFDIEYRWGKIEPFVFEVRGNPGLDYINKQVVPSLSEKFHADLVNLTIAHAYSQYCLHYVPYIADARLTFADHFRENFRKDGHVAIAAKWDEVAASLRNGDRQGRQSLHTSS